MLAAYSGHVERQHHRCLGCCDSLLPWHMLAPCCPVMTGAALYRQGEAGVNELVQQLREMAAGSDIETAEYMIQDIFEEYPFFGQYPSDKLRTTAALIGSMIAQAVFVGRSLFLALKMIIECLEVFSTKRFLLARSVLDVKHKMKYCLDPGSKLWFHPSQRECSCTQLVSVECTSRVLASQAVWA